MAKKIVPHKFHKIKLTTKQYEKLKGTADAHKYKWDEESQRWVQTLRVIRGIAKAINKARKFVLMVDSAHGKRLYVSLDGFTPNIKEARQFADGFDSEERIKSDWEAITKLKLVIKHT